MTTTRSSVASSRRSKPGSRRVILRSVATAAGALAVLVGMSVAPAWGSGSSAPVALDGKVNAHGTKDISKATRAKLEIEADDSYFSPTFVKVRPGERITVTIKNEGHAPHTFTSSTLGIDKTLAPGKSAKVQVTIGSRDSVFAFRCNYHGSMGMQGAFYVATSRSQAPKPAATHGSTAGGGYGY